MELTVARKERNHGRRRHDPPFTRVFFSLRKLVLPKTSARYIKRFKRAFSEVFKTDPPSVEKIQGDIVYHVEFSLVYNKKKPRIRNRFLNRLMTRIETELFRHPLLS